MHSQAEESPFSLSKWYLDCVAPAGDAFIGYSAVLHLKSLDLHYSSVLRHHPNQTPQVDASLRKCPSPIIGASSSILWNSDRLLFDGSWSATAPSIERTLFESDAGSIRWNCLMPRATCRIKLGRNALLEGVGYVEHLTLSIPPWKMPIEELRWGRFLTDEDVLIWIDWRGPHPLTLLYCNGVMVSGPAITDHGILLDASGISLTFKESKILREGPLIKTALSILPGVKKLLALKGLQIYECKWLSRGVLRRQGAEPCAGWAIHEVVRFN